MKPFRPNSELDQGRDVDCGTAHYICPVANPLPSARGWQSPCRGLACGESHGAGSTLACREQHGSVVRGLKSVRSPTLFSPVSTILGLLRDHINAVNFDWVSTACID